MLKHTQKLLKAFIVNSQKEEDQQIPSNSQAAPLKEKGSSITEEIQILMAQRESLLIENQRLKDQLDHSKCKFDSKDA